MKKILSRITLFSLSIIFAISSVVFPASATMVPVANKLADNTTITEDKAILATNENGEAFLLTPDRVDTSYSASFCEDGIEMTKTTVVTVNAADLFEIEQPVTSESPQLALMAVTSWDSTKSVQFTLNNTYRLSGSSVLLTNVAASYKIAQTGITVSNTYVNYICYSGWIGVSQKVFNRYFSGSCNFATGFTQYVPDSEASAVRSNLYATLKRGTSSWTFNINDVRWG